MFKRFFLLALIHTLSSCSSFPTKSPKNPDDSQRPFLGIEFKNDLVQLPHSIDGYYRGIRADFVFPDSPAFTAGLRDKDLIVALNDKVLSDYSVSKAEHFTEWIAFQKIGDTLNLNVIRDQKVLHIPLVLEGRKYSIGKPYQEIKKVDLKNYKDPRKVYPFKALAFNEKTKKETDELLQRYHLMTEVGDQLRIPAVIELQRDPFQVQLFSHWIWDQLSSPKISSPQKSLTIIQTLSADKTLPSKIGKNNIASLIEKIKRSQALLKESFSGISPENYEKILKLSPDLADGFFESIYLQQDENLKRRDQNMSLVNNLQKIKPDFYIKAFNEIAPVLDRSFLSQIKKEAQELLGTKKIYRMATSIGEVIIAGKDNDVHSPSPDKTIALIIDLGGNDQYLNIHSPIIDFEGDDIYRASESWSMASGIANINFIIDTEGNDRYTGLSGNFAATLFGISLLWDLGGNDEYRCAQYCLGVAFGGIALLIDERGHDRYESAGFSQAVGIAGGYGFLLDLEGNDHYYSQAFKASGYGDPGNFEGWSQGVGLGLRGLVSGGLGLLYDKNGRDEFEAGDFSQGGGYYFGWGLLINDGNENDIYRASRYAQGFSAHYSVGGFIDASGDDQYELHHVVGTGISWDLGISLFEDFKGNDSYQTCAMCLGAASHNGITFFTDYQGTDNYRGLELPSSIFYPNNYHSGVSLGFFIDRGGSPDHYEKFKNNSEVFRPGYQWLIDE